MKATFVNRIPIAFRTYPTNLSNAQGKQMGEEDLCTALQNGKVFTYS